MDKLFLHKSDKKKQNDKVEWMLRYGKGEIVIEEWRFGTGD